MMRLKFTRSLFIWTAAAVISLCFGSGAPAAASLNGLQPGMEAPSFSLYSIGESTARTFEELKGEKLTLLVFWSTGSQKSEKALARMQKLYEKYKHAGLAVVGVNVDGQILSPSTSKAVQEVQGKLKITYPMLFDQGLQAFHSFGVIALPTTVIMNRERVIIFELSGFPTVSSEQMAEFLVSSIEGAQPAETVGNGSHKPNKNAVRSYNMGITTLASKRMTATAEKWFSRAVEADPDFILPRLSLARMHAQGGNFTAARAELKEILAREPRHSAALCESGVILIREGKTAEGMALLEAGRQAEHVYTPCFYYTGSAYAQEGKMEQAAAMLNEAETINAFDYRTFEHKGGFYELQKDYRRSSEGYRRALELILQAN